MSRAWNGWAPYVPVAKRRQNAAAAAAKMLKNGEKTSPIQIAGRLIAGTFWGKAWCNHLESFSDYSNRLPRGRTYVRNGSVIHLEIVNGKVNALVQGSSLYKVAITIAAVATEKWESLLKNCSGEIGSVIELLQGKLSNAVMTQMTHQQTGLFPLPKEIKLSCSCPDSANMCKHVAAVLYGVGARLDNEPELLFTLRNVNHLELISKAVTIAPQKTSAKANIMVDQNLSDLFGIDIESSSRSDVAILLESKPEAPLTKKFIRKKIVKNKKIIKTKIRAKKTSTKKAATKKKVVPKKKTASNRRAKTKGKS